MHAPTHTQPFNSLLSGTTLVGQYQKKHSPTHTHLDDRTSFINFLLLLRSVASSLFSLRARQSFLTTSVQVFFGVPLGLGPSTSYSMHFFTQSSSSFRSTCPYQRSPFCCNTMSSIYTWPLSQFFAWKSVFQLNATHPPDHSHLCLLKCHHIFFPYRPGLTSMQHTASHTAAVQPSPHNQ